MQNITEILFKSGFFSNLDYYFADTILKIAKEKDQIIKFSAALVSKISRDGHICLDIEQMADQSIVLSEQNIFINHNNNSDSQTKFKLPSKIKWIKALKSSQIIGSDCNCPLVLDPNNRLYLARYFDYQKRIVANILQRIKYQKPDIDLPLLNAQLDEHFKTHEPFSIERTQGILTQKQTVEKAIKNNFLIISGGPGTGKTYIIDKISKIFKKLSNTDTPPKIINTAPTGKAASKLQEGITIHRLLKIKSITSTIKKQNKKIISADIVIIDETSMIDISLMTKLLEAIPLNSKLVIVGDKNQLGAIETGSVFSDICQSELLKKFIINLNYNFRSGAEKEIEKLAKAINSGDQALIKNILIHAESNNSKTLSFINIKNPSEITSKLKDLIVKGYSPFLRENNLKLANKKHNQFKILCSHRKGYFGTNNLNLITEKFLHECQIHGIRSPFPESILMITENDYNKLLFNGDTGMVIKENGTKKALFINEGSGNSKDSSVNTYALSELKAYEPAFAITVHKSQGSEFDHVLFLLPPSVSPLLTRELLYTAITRAKKKVTIAGNINVIKEAVGSYIKKESGITEMIDSNTILQ